MFVPWLMKDNFAINIALTFTILYKWFLKIEIVEMFYELEDLNLTLLLEKRDFHPAMHCFIYLKYLNLIFISYQQFPLNKTLYNA